MIPDRFSDSDRNRALFDPWEKLAIVSFFVWVLGLGFCGARIAGAAPADPAADAGMAKPPPKPKDPKPRPRPSKP